jgi:lysozyme
MLDVSLNSMHTNFKKQLLVITIFSSFQLYFIEAKAQEQLATIKTGKGVNLRSEANTTSVKVAIPVNWKVRYEPIQGNANWVKVRVLPSDNPGLIDQAMQGYMNAAALGVEAKAQMQSAEKIITKLTKPSVMCSPTNGSLKIQRKNPTDLSVSQNCIDLIANFEGFSSKTYDDRGHLAIGYGHRLKKGDGLKADSVISEEKARELLATDIESKANHVRKALGGVELSQSEFDALVSFHFNQSKDRFDRDSYFFRRLTEDIPNETEVQKNNRYNDAFKGILPYASGNGVPLKGLMKRRAAEVYLATSGVRLDKDQGAPQLKAFFNSNNGTTQDDNFNKNYGTIKWE